MSALADQPAFPHISELKSFNLDGSCIARQLTSGGMTVRQHFASLAMQGLLANRLALIAAKESGEENGITPRSVIAREAVENADALIAALEEKP